MWKDKTISVILPTYNERDSIRACIQSFEKTNVVDEIIVVNNNAAAGTSDEVAQTTAREVHEVIQGYGAAIQRGLLEATGDYLVVSEPDGTFDGEDIFKLLAYADDFDVVLGTRTTTALIGEGANMGLFLKWGNWGVAKMVEFLFNTTHLSDVGCTMRLFSRKAYETIAPRFSVQGSHFGPEMLLLTIEEGLRYIEVPVHYRARVGESMVTGSHRKAFVLGMRMIAMIVNRRFGTVPLVFVGVLGTLLAAGALFRRR